MQGPTKTTHLKREARAGERMRLQLYCCLAALQAEALVLMIVLIAGNLAITRGIALWQRPLRIREKVEAKAVALGGGSSGSVRPVLFLGFIDSYFWI